MSADYGAQRPRFAAPYARRSKLQASVNNALLDGTLPLLIVIPKRHRTTLPCLMIPQVDLWFETTATAGGQKNEKVTAAVLSDGNGPLWKAFPFSSATRFHDDMVRRSRRAFAISRVKNGEDSPIIARS